MSVVHELLNQGHRLATGTPHGHIEALAAQFSTEIELFDAFVPTDAYDTFEANGVIQPWLWGKTPLSPFERRLRLIDVAREGALDELRRELAAPASHARKAPEPVD